MVTRLTRSSLMPAILRPSSLGGERRPCAGGRARPTPAPWRRRDDHEDLDRPGVGGPQPRRRGGGRRRRGRARDRARSARRRLPAGPRPAPVGRRRILDQLDPSAGRVVRGEHARCPPRPVVVAPHRLGRRWLPALRAGCRPGAARTAGRRCRSTMVDSTPTRARPAVEHQVDVVAEVVPHVLGRRRAHLAEAVGRGSGDAATEGRRAAARASGWAGTRRPMVSRPPVTVGSTSGRRCSTTVSGPGQHGVGQSDAAAGGDVRRPLRQRGGRRRRGRSADGRAAGPSRR